MEMYEHQHCVDCGTQVVTATSCEKGDKAYCERCFKQIGKSPQIEQPTMENLLRAFEFFFSEEGRQVCNEHIANVQKYFGDQPLQENK